MSEGALSSVMLIASDGLLQNQGLAVSGNLTMAINNYNSTTPVSEYLGVLTTAFANVGIGNDQITTSTFSSLQQLAANNFPAITDAVPSAYTSSLAIGNSTAGFSGLVATQAGLILGSGDLSKFVQTYGIVQGYIAQNNQYINTVKNSSTLAPTFSNMDALTTGSLSEVSSSLPPFGADLLRLGKTWNLANLLYFGYPSVLLRQVVGASGILPELLTRLINNGVSAQQISTVLQDDANVILEVEAAIYRTMQGVTGDLLDQIKLLLAVTTPGLTSMADLLNPVKSLPNSYLTLTTLAPTGTETTPTATVLVNVYLSANTVNSNLLAQYATDPLYQDLAAVIPPDQALASRAVANSLGQVKNILSLTLPALAAAVSATETNAGLPAINALTQPVPTGVTSSLNSILATGTGPNGTLTIFDFMGATAGIPYTNEFNAAANTINAMQTANSLYTLTNDTDGVYTVMQNTLNGDYTIVVDPGPPADIIITIPGGFPGAGTYTSLDDAFSTGLIPAAANLIANIVANNSSNVTSLNNNFNTMAQQLNSEVNNLAAAQVNFNDLAPNSRSSLLSFGTSLHQIGADITPPGQSPADFFAAIADTSTTAGQAILASFREGRNIDVLNSAGIGSDTQIPSR